MKGMKRLLKMVPDMMKQVDMVKMVPKSDSVCEKNDGTAGISTTNQAMVPETFLGAARDVLTTGAQRFQRSLKRLSNKKTQDNSTNGVCSALSFRCGGHAEISIAHSSS